MESKSKGLEYESALLARYIKTLEKFINSDVMTNEKLKELFPVQKLSYEVDKRDNIPFYIKDKVPPMSIAYIGSVAYKCVNNRYKVWIIFMEDIYFLLEKDYFYTVRLNLTDDEPYSTQIYDFLINQYSIKAETLEG